MGEPIDDKIKKLVKKMTLEEKINQICSKADTEDLVEEGKGDICHKVKGNYAEGLGYIGRLGLRKSPAATAKLANQILESFKEHTRLGIPPLIVDEALHGLMAQGATVFPQAIALASTWEEDLVNKIFSAAALEMRSRGGNLALTPVLDVARDPRWGRTEETFGEDPYLVSKMGMAAVTGLQGTDNNYLNSENKVGATAKHFAAYGCPEGGTNFAPANLSERILREEILLPFKTAVKQAQISSVMASYNEIDCIPVHVNSWLLQDILRKEWNFSGLLMSDGGGVEMLSSKHRVARDEKDAARQALTAGIEMELGQTYKNLKELYEKDKITMELIDKAVTSVLKIKYKLGLFDNSPVDPERAARVNNCKEHRELALEAARKSIILLKNENNILPVNSDDINKVAVIGPNAAEAHLGGYSGIPENSISILEGVKNYLKEDIEVLYAEGCRLHEGVQGGEGWWEDEVKPADPEENRERIKKAEKIAAISDLVILAIGENEQLCREAWAKNHLGDRDDLTLIGEQRELVKAIVETGVPTVAVLINGRPISINYTKQSVPAILEAWYPGQEGGKAVAEIIFGDYNPGGKLPITIPRSTGQLPAYYYQRPSAKHGFVFSTTEPLYPFGYGLSYTDFAYSNLKLSKSRISPEEKTKVKIQIQNTGDRKGEEVVQLYIRDKISSVTRPLKLLKGFQRISLNPGESRELTFDITPEKLCFRDRNMEKKVEPGEFKIMVGPNSVENQSITLKVI